MRARPTDPQFRLLSAATADERMSELERFIEFWYGLRREEYGDPDGCAKCPSLPGPLKRFYSFAGRWPMSRPQADANYFYEGEAGHHLFPPAFVSGAEDGHLRFFMEYQGAWDGLTQPSDPDPPVWISGRWDLPEPGEGIRQVSSTLSGFLVTHCLMTTIYEEGNNFRFRCSSDPEADALKAWFQRSREESELLWEVEPDGCEHYDGSIFLIRRQILVHQAQHGMLTFGARQPEGQALLRAVTAEGVQ